MNIDILPVHVQSALKGIVSDARLQNYTIQANGGSNIGDGFMGQLISVIIKGVQNDIHGKQAEIELNLLCKMPPENENRRKEFKTDTIFGREIYFYTKVLPTFINFQRKKLIPEKDQFRAYPKCYAGLGVDGDGDYAIIMEDLRPKGFQMWNKAKPTTLGNIRLVLEQIGKFHAISFAMKDQKPNEFVEYMRLTDNLHEVLESSNMQELFVKNIERAKNVLRDDHHREIISKVQANGVDYILSCIKENGLSKYAVVSHGDLWQNNVMYCFNKDNVAEDVRFVDWQIIRYISPAMDLIHHIFTATDKPLRDAEYMNLLRHYHDSLSQMIKALGSDPDKLFTFHNLLDEMKNAGNAAFFWTPTFLSISLADSSQINNLDDICDQESNEESNKDFITGLTDESQIKFENRINDTIGDLVSLGYFKELNI